MDPIHCLTQRRCIAKTILDVITRQGGSWMHLNDKDTPQRARSSARAPRARSQRARVLRAVLCVALCLTALGYWPAAAADEPPATPADIPTDAAAAPTVAGRSVTFSALVQPLTARLSRMRLPPEPLSAADILSSSRKLRAGLSLGTTSAGSIHLAASIDPKGKALAILATHASRDRRFGSASLTHLLRDAAADVARLHPGSRVIVGDLSAQPGGKVSGHRSHQAGRDVDITFFYLDKKGRPVESTAMKRVHADGATSDGLRFDAPRSWSLIRALLTHPTSQTQYIFVAKHVRALLLAEADRLGEPADLIARAQEILRQPSDSAPHDDHFHVRVFCDRDERLEGCLNRGRLWPWADLYDGALRARAQTLIAALPTLPPHDAARALDLLIGLEAVDAAPDLAASLHDLPLAVREQAYKTLARLAPIPTPSLTLSLLTQALPQLTSHSDRAQLPALLRSPLPSALSRVALATLLRRSIAHHDAPLALAALLATTPDPTATTPRLPDLGFVPLWIDLLSTPDHGLGAVALQNLQSTTHHAAPSLPTTADLTAHWLTWWSAHSGLSHQDLLLLGLSERGLSISLPLSSAAYPALIAAQTSTPPATALAAHRLLRDLTRDTSISDALSPAERHKRWGAWLAQQTKTSKGKGKSQGKKNK
jgi:penicillin-insensitive murein DD-endopeptidase